MGEDVSLVYLLVGMVFVSSISMLGQIAFGQSPSIKLDQNYILSPRAAAMSSAISTTANGIDSAYYNPAATGGIFWKSTPATIRQLQFPFLGAEASSPTLQLRDELGSAGASTDPDAGDQVISENEDTRYYARSSAGIYLEYARTSFLLFTDTQFAGFNSSEEGVDTETDSNILRVAQSSTSGYGFGLSGAALNGGLYGGVFLASISKDYFEGNITYRELINSSERGKVFSDGGSTYNGLGINSGLIWKMGDTARPVLALVGRNIGNTELTSSDAPQDETAPHAENVIFLDQELVVGFSVTPKVLGGELNLALDYVHNNEIYTNPAHAAKFGGEYALGGVANEAWFALRFGYSIAGASYGFKIGTGLVNLEAASSPTMLFEHGELKPEVRNSILLNINARDM